jgi:hypothetical protein
MYPVVPKDAPQFPRQRFWGADASNCIRRATAWGWTNQRDNVLFAYCLTPVTTGFLEGTWVMQCHTFECAASTFLSEVLRGAAGSVGELTLSHDHDHTALNYRSSVIEYSDPLTNDRQRKGLIPEAGISPSTNQRVL